MATHLQRFKLLVVWGCISGFVLLCCKSFPSVLTRSGSRGLVLLDIRNTLSSLQMWNAGRGSSKILWNITQLQNFSSCEVYNVLDVNKTLYGQPLCLGDMQRIPPTAVMFTTAHDVTKQRSIHGNTFRLWALLGSDVKPVLFISNASKERYLLDKACHHGWDVYLSPLCNSDQLPVLRSMFEVILQMYPGVPFYGYANADIQFEGGLVKTLKEIGQFTIKRLPKVLVIGRRRELKLPPNTSIDSIHQLIDEAKKGSRGFVVAIDYFITRSDFPWKDIPPVVVGRRAYDNYLVAHANKRRFSTIDVSDTVTAVHLAGTEAYAASHKKKGSNYNAKIVGRFDFTHGLTSCARWRTQKEQGRRVGLYRVTKVGFCGRGHWDKRKENWRELLDNIEVERVEWKE
ncbi:hypothetical protein CAPTEDRAFT_189422 [Capitella teleta]|uniref:Uncharacterized protein n=1 Tax=Capitella teleta TaxID=283909 RepID=R7V9N3_CAPTE|nr:hypothetical protein CAPTEDRAFT_189422 [Capitella teleta]|eukprot:ELU15558.1 hypothetical protein CAPTEDRAFT_189422 [Capitella teleta]